MGANICGLPLTGMTKEQSAVAGGNGKTKWSDLCQNTAECAYLCDKLPDKFKKGCKLFASWGWQKSPGKDVYPQKLKWKAVPCPPKFVGFVNTLFSPTGPTESND